MSIFLKDIIKALTEKLDTAITFEEKFLSIQKEKEQLLVDIQEYKEHDKKFAAKIDQIKAKLEKSKAIEDKLNKSENEKKELENKIERNNIEFDSKIQVLIFKS